LTFTTLSRIFSPFSLFIWHTHFEPLFYGYLKGNRSYTKKPTPLGSPTIDRKLSFFVGFCLSPSLLSFYGLHATKFDRRFRIGYRKWPTYPSKPVFKRRLVRILSFFARLAEKKSATLSA
jgi:hypothetical protein